MPQNRTSDFKQLIQEARKHIPVSSTPILPRQPSYEARLKFMQMSQSVSQQIHKLSSPIQNLIKLVQTMAHTLDDNSKAQFTQYSAKIQTEVSSLNIQLTNLESWAQQNGLLKESPGLSNMFANTFGSQKHEGAQNAAHTKGVINSLQHCLVSTTEQFQNALKQHTDTLKNDIQRRSVYGKADITKLEGSTPNFPKSSNLDVDLSFLGQQPDRDENIFQVDPESGQAAQLVVTRNDLAQEDLARSQQLRETVAQVGQLFDRLATVIQFQQPLIERIDENVTDAVFNIEAGTEELGTYWTSLQSSRWLYLKIFAVLIVFAFFFLALR